jgi:hypothetical protein
MKVLSSGLICAGGAALVLALGAAGRPTSLARVEGGLWEIDRLGPGVRPRICLADPMTLASYEHRGRACTRVVISDRPEGALVHYTCVGGGFGRSKIDVLTPRSIRIETQGISNDLPFNYVISARRVGECGSRQSAAAH